ncbi:MAG: Rpn family recombination-promoting nuclease/putative transposase [Tepidisphaerales bacterium]
MDHDQLFKSLVHEFFVELVDLAAPELAAQIERSSVEFLDPEVFFRTAAGDRQQADVVVKVRLRNESACIVVHVEFQSTAQADFAKRMFAYFAGLHLKLDLPVYPIALFSYDQPYRDEPSAYAIDIAGFSILRFGFRVMQLNRMNWREFARRPNPVAAALMAKMRIGAKERPKAKLACLRLLASLELSQAQRHLIWRFVETYLPLSPTERQTFNEELNMLPAQEKEAVDYLPNEWIEEGIEKGIVKANEEWRQSLLRQLRRRFGVAADDLTADIRALSANQLPDFAEALIDFTSLADARTWLAAHRA